jgi:hypothetical protein
VKAGRGKRPVIKNHGFLFFPGICREWQVTYALSATVYFFVVYNQFNLLPTIKYHFTYSTPKRTVEMIPALIESGMILYGILQIFVAFIAVVLAVKWKKFEFLAGLFFLLLFAIVNVIDLFFAIMHGVFIDVAQFGFILLAIIFFIIGMHPSWASRLASGMRKRFPEYKPSRNESLISVLKKMP